MRDFLSGIARFGPGIQNSHAARVPGASQETSKQTSRGYPAPGPKSDRLLGSVSALSGHPPRASGRSNFEPRLGTCAAARATVSNSGTDRAARTVHPDPRPTTSTTSTRRLGSQTFAPVSRAPRRDSARQPAALELGPRPHLFTRCLTAAHAEGFPKPLRSGHPFADDRLRGDGQPPYRSPTSCTCKGAPFEKIEGSKSGARPRSTAPPAYGLRYFRIRHPSL